ncbi:MAG: helix-turn-helix transcriptional regulator [Armatimonadota bacterium]
MYQAVMGAGEAGDSGCIVSVTFVGPDVLCRAFIGLVHGRRWRNCLMSCPQSTLSLTDEIPLTTFDKKGEVLVFISSGGPELHSLLSSSSAELRRQWEGYGSRLVLIRFGAENAALYPVWFRKNNPVVVNADSDPETLLSALVTAAQRQPAALNTSEDAPIFKGGSVQSVPKEDQGLSEREKELAGLAAAGLSNAEIASRLSISLTTVKWHLQQVFAKLKIKRRDQISRSDYLR